MFFYVFFLYHLCCKTRFIKTISYTCLFYFAQKSLAVTCSESFEFLSHIVNMRLEQCQRLFLSESRAASFLTIALKSYHSRLFMDHRQKNSLLYWRYCVINLHNLLKNFLKWRNLMKPKQRKIKHKLSTQRFSEFIAIHCFNRYQVFLNTF